MTVFNITGPDGKKYRVTGDSAEGAVAALKKMLGQPAASQPPAVAPRPTDMGLTRRSEDAAAPRVRPPAMARQAQFEPVGSGMQRPLARQSQLEPGPADVGLDIAKWRQMTRGQRSNLGLPVSEIGAQWLFRNGPLPSTADIATEAAAAREKERRRGASMQDARAAAMQGAQPAPQVPINSNIAPDPSRGTVQAADGTEMVFNPNTGQYTSRELLANNMTPSTLDALGAGSIQGLTMGTGDEIIGAIEGPYMRERMRAVTDASRRDHPVATTVGEVGAALSVPYARRAAGPATLKQAVVAGAKTGAVYGGLYAAASADGGVINRIKEGAEGAIAGAIFGATVPVAVNFGTKAFRAAFSRASEKPSIESLRTAKTAAYNAVDSAGERFSGAETKALADNVRTALQGTNYVPGVDRQTDAVVQLLDGKAGQELTLGQLDKLRKNFFDRVASAKNETGIYEAIDAIDELIISRTSTSELLDAARLANARYKKAELLDRAFQKARDQTASTGSGGNILNKYRQAVTSIINDPKRARWFSQAEIDTMRAFVEGTPGQNVMRLIGKLAPSGNGLMTALNLGAVAANPMAIVGSAVASGAKAVSDGATERGAQSLIGMVAGKPAPAPRAPVEYPMRLNALAGPFGGAF